MSDQTPQSETRPRRRWSRWVLVASLTVNLLVLGLVVGANFSGHRGHDFDHRGPERGAIRDLGFGPIAKALDDKDRREIGRAFRRESGSFKENRAALEQDFNTLLQVLRSDRFDPVRFETALSAQADRLRARGETLRKLVAEKVAAMSVDERNAFADRLEDAVDRKSSRKSH
ncbi:Heavy-metal resistance [Aliiroseovarius halocynthiae]|nr:periplasmic heavy metal sensor [Aliiroseovarius halocynthiae]SMR71451.1 Heavy-metal resistance [Aliiroseovarius halocynthiae]